MTKAKAAPKPSAPAKKAKKEESTGEKKADSNAATLSVLQRIKAEKDPWAACISGDILKTPKDIQALIDSMPYNTGDARCPKDALAVGVVHCLDGALLAAAALSRLGHAPKICYLGADGDDGHALALFTTKDGKHHGAIAKSNFSGIRFRCAVYSSHRELVMSYFNDYFTTEGERTLRTYTNPIDLSKVPGWETTEAGFKKVEALLEKEKEIKLFAKKLVDEQIVPVDDRLLRSGMLGLNPAGAYDPNKKH